MGNIFTYIYYTNLILIKFYMTANINLFNWFEEKILLDQENVIIKVYV